MKVLIAVFIESMFSDYRLVSSWPDTELGGKLPVASGIFQTILCKPGEFAFLPGRLSYQQYVRKCDLRPPFTVQ